MEIKKLSTDQELRQAFRVLRELRTTLDWETFTSIYRCAERADGYCLVGLFSNNELVGVMGMRILFDFVHGKHVYIDDLVVSGAMRSKGMGRALLKYAEEYASEMDCRKLRLSTGTENTRGMAFYEREGWTLRSVTYKKDTATGALA